LSERRKTLEALLARRPDALRLSPLLEAPTGQVLEAVRKLGLEGVIGKRLDSRYEPGERSGAWIKLRTNLEQEFVIGGYIQAHADSTRCSWVSTRPRNSSSWQR
jgi:bifunctional non-homologous end joining protein LigD